MSMMEATHPHLSTKDNMTNALTGIFLMTGLCFNLMASPAQLYDVAFKILSLVPVFMAAVINYPKFEQRVSTWYKKRKGKRAQKRSKR